MFEARPTVFGVTVEVYFSQPISFQKDRLDYLAGWLTNTETGFGVRPDQIRVRNTDVVFDYELKATLFGGNAEIRYDAEKATLKAQNARTRQDAELLQKTIGLFLEMLVLPTGGIVNLSAHAHVKLPSPAAHEKFLDPLRTDSKIISPGILGFVRVDGWNEEIRIAIERSIGTDDSLFVVWQTSFSAQEWIHVSKELVGSLESGLAIYGIVLKPLHSHES